MGTTYYHADGLGSIVNWTSAAGAVVHSYVYDAWGAVESGSSVGGYAFTGREHDPETGLAYYRERYYDPELGRFLSEDPALLSEGPNLYAYVKNRPLHFVDPFGDKTRVIVTGNSMGGMEYGTHSALYIDNGPGGKPFLFDPAGTYRVDSRGNCGCLFDEEADLEDYLEYHLKTPDEFYYLIIFDTTPEEETEIINKIDPDNFKDPRGLNCTIAVSNVLKGTGPFKNLEATKYPSNLLRQLLKLSK